MTSEEFLNNEIGDAHQTYDDVGITILHGIEHSQMCEILDRYHEHKLKLLSLCSVTGSLPLKDTDLEKWINDKKEKIGYKNRNEMSRAFYDAEFAGWELCFDKIKSGNYQ